MQIQDFQFHGVWVRVHSRTPRVAAHFRHDFHHFLKDPSRRRPDLLLKEGGQEPRWVRGRRIGRAEIFPSPAGQRRVRYFGGVSIDYRPDKGTALVWGKDAALAYEGCLSVVMSFVGEWLDRRGLHRIHGLGVATEQGGALFLAPSGTGKSTLALGLLRKTALSLLSDDTPLVGAGGELFSFPQRIATRDKPKGFSDRHVRRFRRARYGEKYVLGAEAFGRRIRDRSPARWVVLTQRGGAPGLIPTGRWRLLWPLVKWLVVGYETPQMWELFLRPSPDDLRWKTRILRSRVRAGWDLIRRVKPYRLVLHQDGARNVAWVRALLEEPA